MKFLYFSNGTEDAAAFPVSALTSIDAGDDVVDIYFDTNMTNEASVNKVVVACADGASAAVAKEIALAASGGGSVLQSLIVVRDDVAGTGLAGITGVTSISIDYATS